MSKTEIMGTALNSTLEFLARGKAATGLLLWGCPIAFLAVMVHIFGGWSTTDSMDHIKQALDSFLPYFLSAVLPVAAGMVGPEIAGRIAEALASLRRKKW